MDESVTPPGWKPGMDVEVPEIGWYIWEITLTSCEWQDKNTDKPYMLIGAVVDSGEFDCEEAGYSFDFHIYYHLKSERWCKYFLKKFDYPDEYMDKDKPELNRMAIKKLRGKVLVEIREFDGRYGPIISPNVKGFDHIGGDDLEGRLEKIKKKDDESQWPAVDEPEINLDADIGPSSLDILDQVEKD